RPFSDQASLGIFLPGESEIFLLRLGRPSERIRNPSRGTWAESQGSPDRLLYGKNQGRSRSLRERAVAPSQESYDRRAIPPWPPRGPSEEEPEPRGQLRRPYFFRKARAKTVRPKGRGTPFSSEHHDLGRKPPRHSPNG